MKDAVIISDLHLGGKNCQIGELCTFLDKIRHETKRLILNGDVLDSLNFHRLNKHHWRALSLLRKMSDDIEVIWVYGNHDGPAELLSPLIGIRVVNQYIFTTGTFRILVLHGHQFDEFINKHPFITWVGDKIYGMLQAIDSSHRLARFAKHSSKQYLHCSERMKTRAVNYAATLDCQGVCCGHSHHATHEGCIAQCKTPVVYINSGCWTEKPCTYVTAQLGELCLEYYRMPERET